MRSSILIVFVVIAYLFCSEQISFFYKKNASSKTNKPLFAAVKDLFFTTLCYLSNSPLFSFNYTFKEKSFRAKMVRDGLPP